MTDTSSPTPEPAIELRVKSLAQLFDSLDPAPFHEKSLDPAAHRYLLAYAREVDLSQPLRLLVHIPETLRTQTTLISEAIHNHFQLELTQAKRELHARMHSGRQTLMLGLAILTLCSLTRNLLLSYYADAGWLTEGLLILGWVALWRPMEILLFERREAGENIHALGRLAQARVEFSFTLAETSS